MILVISLLIVAVIIFAGLVTLIETSVRVYPAESPDEDEPPSYKAALKIKRVQDEPETMSAVSEAARTFSIAVAASLTSYLVHHEFAENHIEWSTLTFYAPYVSGILLTAFLYWLFSVLIPKAIGEKYYLSIAPIAIYLLLPVIAVFRHPVTVGFKLANLILSPLKVTSTFSSMHASEDKIRALIDEGVKTGALDETEHEIIRNALEFNDLRAREVMVPRTEMVAVELTADNKEMLDEILKTGHSLIPVYQDSLDKIVGIIHIKDMMRSFAERGTVDIKSCLRPVHYVPETKLISDILTEMQARGLRITIVTDEYGGTEGVITLEDILSEIVGEITVTGEQPIPEHILLPDGGYSVMGSMVIQDFNDIFNYELPVSESYNTVAGFVAFHTGKILNQGEVFLYNGLHFELIKKIKQKMVEFKVYSEDKSFSHLER